LQIKGFYDSIAVSGNDLTLNPYNRQLTSTKPMGNYYATKGSICGIIGHLPKTGEVLNIGFLSSPYL